MQSKSIQVEKPAPVKIDDVLNSFSDTIQKIIDEGTGEINKRAGDTNQSMEDTVKYCDARVNMLTSKIHQYLVTLAMYAPNKESENINLHISVKATEKVVTEESVQPSNHPSFNERLFGILKQLSSTIWFYSIKRSIKSDEVEELPIESRTAKRSTNLVYQGIIDCLLKAKSLHTQDFEDYMKKDDFLASFAKNSIQIYLDRDMIHFRSYGR